MFERDEDNEDDEVNLEKFMFAKKQGKIYKQEEDTFEQGAMVKHWKKAFEKLSEDNQKAKIEDINITMNRPYHFFEVD